MATRAIVTSQPEVACEICGRRLLRGEQPDRFLVDARPCVVCELCLPRARQAGWIRFDEAGPEPPSAERRVRSGNPLAVLLRRMRAPASPASPAAPARRDGASGNGRARESVEGRWGEPLRDDGVPAYDGALGVAAPPVEEDGRAPGAEEAAQGPDVVGEGADVFDAPQWPTSARWHAGEERTLLEAGVEAFNSTRHPRRIAGIARSLGVPSVTVRPAGEERVAVIVAWELCWYRWELDAYGSGADIDLAGEGTDLEELPDADLLANAALGERGHLRLHTG